MLELGPSSRVLQIHHPDTISWDHSWPWAVKNRITSHFEWVRATVATLVKDYSWMSCLLHWPAGWSRKWEKHQPKGFKHSAFMIPLTARSREPDPNSLWQKQKHYWLRIVNDPGILCFQARLDPGTYENFRIWFLLLELFWHCPFWVSGLSLGWLPSW